MHDPRLDKLADVLVSYSIGVRKDDVILIKGPMPAEPFYLCLARRVLKAGGHPVMLCVPEQFEEIVCKHGDSRQLRFTPPIEKHMVETVNGYIAAWATTNTRALSNVDPKKQQERSKARKPILDTMLKRSSQKGARKLRWVGTMYPTQSSAQDAAMSLEEYADFVFKAGLLHLPNPAREWRKIRTAQQRVCDSLSKASELRFVAPNGTDLRVGVQNRTWINCAGENNFPDGEVFTGPIEDATEGTVCYSFPAMAGGREITDIRLQFKNGKVVDASAGRNEDFLIQMIDQDKGARILGEVAIGTNYSIKNYTRNTLFDEKIGGTFHAALGAAYPESGGKNKSGLHWDMVCDLRTGGRIEADGKVISKNGRFINKTWPQPTRRR